MVLKYAVRTGSSWNFTAVLSSGTMSEGPAGSGEGFERQHADVIVRIVAGDFRQLADGFFGRLEGGDLQEHVAAWCLFSRLRFRWRW